MLQEEYERYRTKSKRELLEAFSALSREQMQSGELDREKMEQTYRMLAPLLDERQRTTLRALLDALG